MTDGTSNDSQKGNSSRVSGTSNQDCDSKAALHQPPASTLVPIKIGDKLHNVDTTKVPYFKAFLDFQCRSGQIEDVPTHSDIPPFGLANLCVDKGFRRSFRVLGTDLNQYHTLCSTLDYLQVNVHGKALKHPLSQTNSFGDLVIESKAQAREDAFRVLYYLLVESNARNEPLERQQMIRKVFFIATHWEFFDLDIRKVLRAAYEERFEPSALQLSKLNWWP